MPALTNTLTVSSNSITKDAYPTYQTLVDFLSSQRYTFICPTPETHARVIAKRNRLEGELIASTLQDLFGWSIPADISTTIVPADLLRDMTAAKLLIPDGQLLRPTIRVSRLSLSQSGLYIHSAWPTTAADSAFFGPDSYRYMRTLTSLAHTRLYDNPPKQILDLCTGPGVGALHLSRLFPDAEVYGVDINPKALVLARFNAPGVRFIQSDGLTNYHGPLLDVVSIHPPFIANDQRIYAAGGPTGIELTLRLIGEALSALRTGGELWSYTAVPVGFDGSDSFRAALERDGRWRIARYELVDADIFGEEMENDASYPRIGALQAIELALVKL